MQDFPANSAKAKNARPEGPPQADRPQKVEPITSATTVRRKRRLGKQFKETFIGGSARSAAEYMATDVVVPAIKDTIVEALQGGIERLFNGDTRPKRGGGVPNGYASVGRVDYARMSTSTTRQPEPRTMSRQARARHDFRDIIIPNRQEAEDVIDTMFDVLSRYGRVEVALLYELTGIQTSHVDHKWGWTEMRGARAVRHPRSGGYLLNLPDPEQLD